MRDVTVVYLAGPYRASDREGVEVNIERAREVAKRVWYIGHRLRVLTPCLCPHANTAFFDGFEGIPDSVWLDGDIALIGRCDAMLMMDGWEASKGASVEKEIALTEGIPVFFSLIELEKWVHDYPTADHTILDEAKRLVWGDRQHDYGHPRDDFGRTAQMWSAILGTEVCAMDVAMCMICVKLSRQSNAPKRDNLVDIAGYAATMDRLVGEKM